MMNDILSLAKQFIAIKSIATNPDALKEILELAISYLPGFTTERFESNGSHSALIYNTTQRPNKLKIILNGHLDVVPGKEYQYIPKIIGNKLYGVGSMDMKANAACLIIAFRDISTKLPYPIGLQLVTDEEVGGFHGTKYQVDAGVRAEFVVAGEPTNLNIVHKAKGILWATISCTGKTAHGAYPWRGENAIWKMNTFLNLLNKRHPGIRTEQWVTTINLSKIETTNTSFNKIPDDCIISLDIRFIPEDEKKIVESIRELLPSDFTLTIHVQEPSLFVEKNNVYITRLKKIAETISKKEIVLYGAQGSSDARHFTKVGCDGVEFGPIGGEIGTDNEWVDISSLKTYYQILNKFLLSQ